VGGAQKGTGVRGQATWPRISACVRAGPRRFAGKAELTGRSHGAARESGRTWKRLIALTIQAREAEIERGARATGADTLAPTGQREGERERERGGGGGNKMPLSGGAHLAGGRRRPRGGGGGAKQTAAIRWSPPVRRAGSRAVPLGWTGSVWAEMVFLFPGNSIVFPFYFL
jgi:hypothetical protein